MDSHRCEKVPSVTEKIMPFITFMMPYHEKQLSIDDILNGITDTAFEAIKRGGRDIRRTRTFFRNTISEELTKRFDYIKLIGELNDFNSKYKELIELEDKSKLYHTMWEKKKSGKYRRIDAPCPELSHAQKEFVYLLEYKFFAKYHDNAFAYIHQRCTKDAAERHQANRSKCMLGTDIHNFFGTTTFDYALRMFSNIFPFSEIVKFKSGEEAFRKALSICFFNGTLPQGTPSSPMLSNIVTIPFDYLLSKKLREKKRFIVYTRFADDMFISARAKAELSGIVTIIKETFAELEAPYQINMEKTHCRTGSGSTWILGMMLNENNEITIGHKNKELLRATLHAFVCDWKNGEPWSVSKTQKLAGKINYYRSIEGAVIDKIVDYKSTRSGIDINGAIKQIISSKVS